METTVILRAEDGYAEHLPPEPVGRLLFHMPRAVLRTVRMRFEGRSVAPGRPPGWLARASDIRLLDVTSECEARIVFDCPELGTAAEEFYEQQQLWRTRPDPELTGLDLLCDVVDQVAEAEQDSALFDKGLLNSLRSLEGAISNEFEAIDIQRHDGRHVSTIDQSVIRAAAELTESTPEPYRVRVSGELDMIRASTGAFELLLDTGEALPAVRLAGDVTEISELLGQRVVVSGLAVFRPSGNLLRVEADSIAQATDADRVWSEVPRPREERIDRSQLVVRQTPRSGIAAVIGAWPGDESDEQIAELLEEIS